MGAVDIIRGKHAGRVKGEPRILTHFNMTEVRGQMRTVLAEHQVHPHLGKWADAGRIAGCILLFAVCLLINASSASSDTVCNVNMSNPVVLPGEGAVPFQWGCPSGTGCGAQRMACWQVCPYGWNRCGCSCMPPGAVCCGDSSYYCSAPSYCGPANHGALFSWDNTCVAPPSSDQSSVTYSPQLYLNAGYLNGSLGLCKGNPISSYPMLPPRNSSNGSASSCDQMQSSASTQFQRQEKQADGIWAQAQELRNTGPDLRALDQQVNGQFRAVFQQIDSFDQGAESRLNDLSSKVDDLETEKAAALKELAEGLFCSLCRRTKTEIEMEEHESFEAHLARVQGEAVPATPEEIAQRAYEYDQKIAAASQAYDD